MTPERAYADNFVRKITLRPDSARLCREKRCVFRKSEYKRSCGRLGQFGPCPGCFELSTARPFAVLVFFSIPTCRGAPGPVCHRHAGTGEEQLCRSDPTHGCNLSEGAGVAGLRCLPGSAAVPCVSSPWRIAAVIGRSRPAGRRAGPAHVRSPSPQHVRLHGLHDSRRAVAQSGPRRLWPGDLYVRRADRRDLVRRDQR